MPTLTLTREAAKAAIYIPMVTWNPDLEDADAICAQVHGQLDTGNDHTIISRELFDALKLEGTGREMLINGVTGGSTGTTAHIGFAIPMDGGNAEIQRHEVVVARGVVVNAVLIGRDLLQMFDVILKRDGTMILTN